MNDTINQVGAGAPALPAERAAFEALFKMPSHCIRVGDGYVATEYNAWGAHEYSHLRRGWLAALKWQASAAAPAAPVVQAEQEPVAWMTHHDEPMFFSAEKEAAAYCDNDESPIPLYAAPPAHPDAALVEALEHARQFIRNGVDLGFIRMPDTDAPDPAHETLPRIDAALSTYRAARAALVVELPEPSPHIRYMDHRGAVETIMAQVRDALERQGVKVKP